MISVMFLCLIKCVIRRQSDSSRFLSGAEAFDGGDTVALVLGLIIGISGILACLGALYLNFAKLRKASQNSKLRKAWTFVVAPI